MGEQGVPRILYVSGGTLDNGGISSYMRNYYRHMDKEKIQIDFVVQGEKSTYDEEIQSAGGRVYHLPTKRENLLAHDRELNRLLHAQEYQIVHAHMDGMNGFFLRKAQKKGVPIRISHSHNSDFLTQNKLKLVFHKWSRSLIGRHATHLWACSEVAGKWLYGQNEFDVIPNAIDVQRFAYQEASRDRLRQELGLEEQFVIGHVGRLSYQKNQTFLLQCVAEVIKQRPDTVLLLVGGGEDRQDLLAQAKVLGIESQVLFLGEREDVAALYSAFDIFVFPSHFEGFGTAALEAQANGLTCICSTQVTQEINVTGKALFIDLQAPLADWTTQILQANPRDAEAAKQIVSAGYDIHTAAKRLERQYLSLLSGVTPSDER